MKRILTILILFVSINSFSQGSITLTDKPFEHTHQFKDEIVAQLEASEHYAKLPADEKFLFYWVNLVRMYPKTYLKEIVQPFLKQYPEINNSYAQSLIKDLQQANAAQILLPGTKLQKAAAAHSTDLAGKGLPISHTSSNNKSFTARMNDHGIYDCASENIYDGKKRALETILFLLIDNGVPNVGHRKNILDPKMSYMGAHYYQYKNNKDRYYMVQTIGCNP